MRLSVSFTLTARSSKMGLQNKTTAVRIHVVCSIKSHCPQNEGKMADLSDFLYYILLPPEFSGLQYYTAFAVTTTGVAKSTKTEILEITVKCLEGCYNLAVVECMLLRRK